MPGLQLRPRRQGELRTVLGGDIDRRDELRRLSPYRGHEGARSVEQRPGGFDTVHALIHAFLGSPICPGTMGQGHEPTIPTAFVVTSHVVAIHRVDRSRVPPSVNRDVYDHAITAVSRPTLERMYDSYSSSNLAIE